MAGIGQKYVTTLLALGAAPFRIEVQFYADSLITRARNILVTKFLETKIPNMLFVDADIGFELEQVCAMLKWSQENPGVVAGTYRAKCKAVEYGRVGNRIFKERRKISESRVCGRRLYAHTPACTGKVNRHLSGTKIFFDTCPGHEGRLRFFRAYD